MSRSARGRGTDLARSDGRSVVAPGAQERKRRGQAALAQRERGQLGSLGVALQESGHERDDRVRLERQQRAEAGGHHGRLLVADEHLVAQERGRVGAA